MANTQKIDYGYYDSHDFGEDMLEAEKNGKLYTASELGCSNAFEAGRKLLAMKSAKEKTAVPVGVVTEVKERAAGVLAMLAE